MIPNVCPLLHQSISILKIPFFVDFLNFGTIQGNVSSLPSFKRINILLSSNQMFLANEFIDDHDTYTMNFLRLLDKNRRSYGTSVSSIASNPRVKTCVIISVAPKELGC